MPKLTKIKVFCLFILNRICKLPRMAALMIAYAFTALAIKRDGAARHQNFSHFRQFRHFRHLFVYPCLLNLIQMHEAHRMNF
jgi:hypothetical protein